MEWNTAEFEVAESAKEEIWQIMKPYAPDMYCPMLSYGNTSYVSSTGQRISTPNCWRVYANEYQRLNTAPSYYVASGVKLYVASPQLVESGSILEFVNGQFIFSART